MDGNTNDTMFAEERKLKIIDLLNQNKKVTVAGLVRLFNVSSATVRSEWACMLRSMKRPTRWRAGRSTLRWFDA